MKEQLMSVGAEDSKVNIPPPEETVVFPVKVQAVSNGEE
jgi:hypothetical protein